MNRTAAPPTRQDVSLAVAQLMPQIIRGVQLDFFVKKGVTQTQFLVLTAIHALQPCPMGLLARNLHIQMPTATGIVDRLVRRGYVRRSTRAEDRRCVTVEMTPEGQRFIQQFQAVVRQRWEEVLKALDAEELTAFHRVLTTLRQRLSAQP